MDNKSIEDKNFKFNSANKKLIKEILKKYPKAEKRSALMPLLDLAMRQSGGWIPDSAMHEISSILSVPYIRVFEVASFYSMYNLKPVGKYFIQICTTTPCWLRGSNNLVKTCKDFLGINVDETTQDNLFTIKEVECLGACVNAPMVQINDDYYEDLDGKSLVKILDNFKNGRKNKVGTQIPGKKGGEPYKLERQ